MLKEVEGTGGQKDAGNYRMDHLALHGLDISIETPRGSMRSGKSPDGKEWSMEMPWDYGYIRRTKGKDGDHVDVFIGAHKDSEVVFVVDQVRGGCRFGGARGTRRAVGE